MVFSVVIDRYWPAQINPVALSAIIKKYSFFWHPNQSLGFVKLAVGIIWILGSLAFWKVMHVLQLFAISSRYC